VLSTPRPPVPHHVKSAFWFDDCSTTVSPATAMFSLAHPAGEIEQSGLSIEALMLICDFSRGSSDKPSALAMGVLSGSAGPPGHTACCAPPGHQAGARAHVHRRWATSGGGKTGGGPSGRARPDQVTDAPTRATLARTCLTPLADPQCCISRSSGTFSKPSVNRQGRGADWGSRRRCRPVGREPRRGGAASHSHEASGLPLGARRRGGHCGHAGPRPAGRPRPHLRARRRHPGRLSSRCLQRRRRTGRREDRCRWWRLRADQRCAHRHPGGAVHAQWNPGPGLWFWRSHAQRPSR